MSRHAHRSRRLWWPSAAALIVGGVSVTGASQAGTTSVASSNVTRGCVDRFDAAKDYFPDKATIEDAVHFSVTYRRSYKVLSVPATGPDSQAERYVLRPKASVPRLEGDLIGAQIASVPISSLYSASMTHSYRCWSTCSDWTC